MVIIKVCQKNNVIDSVQLDGETGRRTRQWVVDRLRENKTIRSGNSSGPRVVLYRERFITTEGNHTERDNLDSLPSCC